MKKKLFLANLLRYMWIVAVVICIIAVFIAFIGFLKLGSGLIVYMLPIVGMFGFIAFTSAIIYINKYDAPIHIKPEQYMISKSLKRKNKIKI